MVELQESFAAKEATPKKKADRPLAFEIQDIRSKCDEVKNKLVSDLGKQEVSVKNMTEKLNDAVPDTADDEMVSMRKEALASMTKTLAELRTQQAKDPGGNLTYYEWRAPSEP